MNSLPKAYIGVDVSKDLLDVYIHPIMKFHQVENSNKGIADFLEVLVNYDVQQIGFESTGGYENLLLQCTQKAGYEPWPINPAQIKAFKQSEGKKAKTDQLDAKMIALFVAQKTRPYVPLKLSDEALKLKSLVKRRIDLVDACAAEKTRLKHPGQIFCAKDIEAHIEFLEQRINLLAEEIQRMIQDNDDWKNKSSKLESIPGVGKNTASVLVATLPELGTLDKKEIAALVGVAPFTKQSGQYKGASFIEGGRFEPRESLYMSILSGIRCNPVLKEFYERLCNKGKKPKVAMVGCMRKLIVIMNEMIKDNSSWDFKTA